MTPVGRGDPASAEALARIDRPPALDERSNRAFFWIAVLGTLPLVALPFFAVPEARNYRYSSAFLVPMLWGVRLARRPLRLAPLHYALFAGLLLLHDLGALGWYRRDFSPLAFDTYVHFAFGLVGALILERAFRATLPLRGARLALVVVVFLLGLAAIHELIELASTLALGDAGMYQADGPDRYDTHKDLFLGLVGSVVGLTASAVARRARVRRVSAERGASRP